VALDANRMLRRVPFLLALLIPSILERMISGSKVVRPPLVRHRTATHRKRFSFVGMQVHTNRVSGGRTLSRYSGGGAVPDGRDDFAALF
jgi:hypothetical protein